MRNYFLFFLLLSFHLSSSIEDHYKKVEKTTKCQAPKGIDFVYLINLDKRPERWINCMVQLGPRGIIPQRFPGIYGWTLSPEDLHDIGLKFEPDMWTGREPVMYFPLDKGGDPIWINLDHFCYGRAVYSGWTVKGAIGCILSHLSILKDAYDSGYNTVWVMEDDIVLKDDPHKLSDAIDALDALVGKNSWDVLYTDCDYLKLDETKTLAEQVPLLWRPDMPFRDFSFMAEHEDLNEQFMQIGSRIRAHSIIYRRSGLRKILEYFHTHDYFLPFDWEIALVPDIKLFTVKKDIVSFNEVTSDTRMRNFNE